MELLSKVEETKDDAYIAQLERKKACKLEDAHKLLERAQNDSKVIKKPKNSRGKGKGKGRKVQGDTQPSVATAPSDPAAPADPSKQPGGSAATGGKGDTSGPPPAGDTSDSLAKLWETKVPH